MTVKQSQVSQCSKNSLLSFMCLTTEKLIYRSICPTTGIPNMKLEEKRLSSDCMAIAHKFDRLYSSLNHVSHTSICLTTGFRIVFVTVWQSQFHRDTHVHYICATCFPECVRDTSYCDSMTVWQPFTHSSG